MPWTQWHWSSTRRPASSSMGGEHYSTITVRVPFRLCPLSMQPKQRKPLLCEISRAHLVTMSCPPASKPLLLSAQSHVAQKQQNSNPAQAELFAWLWCFFPRVNKILVLWELAGRTALPLWPRLITFGSKISSSRLETHFLTHANRGCFVSPWHNTLSTAC